MTPDKAIFILKRDNPNNIAIRSGFEDLYDQRNEAFSMAIEALQQEPVLDKMRAEVKTLPNANPSYSGYIDVVDREDVLEIIDKYKEGSEDKG